jgi:hypothetical protein
MKTPGGARISDRAVVWVGALIGLAIASSTGHTTEYIIGVIVLCLMSGI